MTTDEDLDARIERLEDERSSLRRDEGAGGDAEADATRLEEVRVELDRLFDLKRQRTARRDAGEDPDGATERPAGTVEGYEG